MISLENEKKIADELISKATNIRELDEIRIKYFGKKNGMITEFMKTLASLSTEEKKRFGEEVNILKNFIVSKLEGKKNQLEYTDMDDIDITLPGKPFRIGHLHPITQVRNKIYSIFTGLGFSIATGPDIETDYNNFEALNFSKDHPARDSQDTFFLKAKDENNIPLLLRTHTSPVQIRFMTKNKPPFQIISPGNVYRCDSDVSHTPMFNQVEGLVVGEDISFANLKWVLENFIHKLFGENINLRFRPSFFPFTEPSSEVDISCIICSGKGCRLCKNSGWLEVLGCGMVHPNVFKNVGYDPEKTYGFAFGMGIERLTLLYFGIDDIRLLYSNNLKFLEQF